ncbi:MAG: DgaE family pyridoxal phosphate-dependent ammonia lyase [Mycoplasmatales bacterium]
MDVYNKYDLKKVINASGKMTVLGVSKVSEEVTKELNVGLNNFFIMDELFKNTGKFIAKQLDAEAACITSSASAGIALSIASLIAKDNLYDTENLYRVNTSKRDVLMLKGHNINYGGNIETMVNMGYGKVKEVGSANVSLIEHVEQSINDDTLCFLYVKSHHCVQKNQVSLEKIIEICSKKSIPVIVDAAAEEDMKHYYKAEADIVVYSGAKAIEGPTSGFVIGKKQYIDNVYFQYKGIGRAMKIGKEGILGLSKAIELFTQRESSITLQKELVSEIISKVNKNDIFSLDMSMDLAGRDIARVMLNTNPLEAKSIIDYLVNDSTAIETRNHQSNLGKIEFDVRQVSNEEAKIIAERLNKYVEKKCN